MNYESAIHVPSSKDTSPFHDVVVVFRTAVVMDPVKDDAVILVRVARAEGLHVHSGSFYVVVSLDEDCTSLSEQGTGEFWRRDLPCYFMTEYFTLDDCVSCSSTGGMTLSDC